MIAQNSIVQNKWAKSPYCKLLLHMNGENYGTIFLDESPSPKTISIGGTVITSNTQKRYGTTSAYLASATTNRLTASSSDFETIRTMSLWYYRTTSWTGNPGLMQSGAAASNGYFQYAGGMNYYNQSNSNIASFGSPSINTWHHYAAIADGTNVKLYLDGYMVASASHTNYLFTGTALSLFSYGTEYACVGYFDEVALFSVVVPISDLYPARAPLYDYAIAEWGGQ